MKRRSDGEGGGDPSDPDDRGTYDRRSSWCGATPGGEDYTGNGLSLVPTGRDTGGPGFRPCDYLRHESPTRD